jgi:molecular chaperone GrpE
VTEQENQQHHHEHKELGHEQKEEQREEDTNGNTPVAEEASESAEEEVSDHAQESEADEREREIQQLRAQLESAQAEAQENYQRFLRAQADFENFRRRTRQEKEELAKYAAAGIIESLLPVIDNFERAIVAGKTADADSPLLQGVEMVYKQLMDVLSSAGLEEIESLGKPFDPFLHEAVMKEPSEDHEEGTVIEVLQKGYRLKDRVIRPAMVKVSG